MWWLGMVRRWLGRRLARYRWAHTREWSELPARAPARPSGLERSCLPTYFMDNGGEEMPGRSNRRSLVRIRDDLVAAMSAAGVELESAGH
jgi:hypothetical protein